MTAFIVFALIVLALFGVTQEECEKCKSLRTRLRETTSKDTAGGYDNKFVVCETVECKDCGYVKVTKVEVEFRDPNHSYVKDRLTSGEF